MERIPKKLGVQCFIDDYVGFAWYVDFKFNLMRIVFGFIVIEIFYNSDNNIKFLETYFDEDFELEFNHSIVGINFVNDVVGLEI